MSPRQTRGLLFYFQPHAKMARKLFLRATRGPFIPFLGKGMAYTEKTLSEALNGSYKRLQSWRLVRDELYPGEEQISHTLLYLIAKKGHVPKRADIRRALGLPLPMRVWGNSEAPEAYLAPDHRVLSCGYRHCKIRFIANAPNQTYHAPQCGRLERRARAKDPDNANDTD